MTPPENLRLFHSAEETGQTSAFSLKYIDSIVSNSLPPLKLDSWLHVNTVCVFFYTCSTHTHTHTTPR